MSLTLYELAGADAAVRFSPHCWKARMALAHKGLAAECRPWRFTDKPDIAFSGQGLVPVLVEDGTAISDSWRIALHLEARHPERPSLFGSEQGRALARFVNGWADSAVVAPLRPLLTLDIFLRVHEKDRAYFRASREARFGRPLEELDSDTAKNIADFRAALAPARTLLGDQPFLAGAAPAYADYALFGLFMWARCISEVRLLEEEDPVFGWRERLLDAFGGLARNAPVARAGAAA